MHLRGTETRKQGLAALLAVTVIGLTAGCEQTIDRPSKAAEFGDPREGGNGSEFVECHA